MNKDVIYIDTEDDITAIIGRIKSSKEKIVALVPPKRIGVLQSAVNLRLLARISDVSDKKLVLITNNKALIALSASAHIPIAKNLQSKPEFAEIAALEVDDGDDIIDGNQLPIGDLERTADKPSVSSEKEIIPPHKIKHETIESEMAGIDIDGDDQPADFVIKNSADTHDLAVKGENAKKKVKIPDFSKFRKRLILGITGGVLFIVFLVWAIIFAPAATVIVTAKTSSAPVSITLKLNGTEPTDLTKNTIQTITKSVKKDISVDFIATGKDEVGTKAKGTVIFSNCYDGDTFTIPAGTYISSGGNNYIVQNDTSVGGAGIDEGACLPGTSSASSVIAADVGSDYNTAANATFLVAGYNYKITAKSANGLTGGESHEATVVTQEDVLKASQALVELTNNDVKQQLIKQFSNGEKVINDSFDVARADAVSVPAVNAEAVDGKAKLTSASTFTITAVAKSEIQTYLKDAIKKQMDNPKTQRIYDDGIDKVTLSGYFKNDLGATINVSATGKVGPNIEENNIKNIVKGSEFGDVQAVLGRIQGVSDVDVQYSYFWVNRIPEDIKKIDVEFKIQND